MSLKFNIFSSLWAIAPPGYEPFRNICCIKEDGYLDEDKYRAFMKVFKACGATDTRCLPFLVNEDWITADPDYMPFRYVGHRGGYDLNIVSSIYLYNIKRMATIANSFGIRFWLSLFSNAHGNRENSPWMFNINGFKGFHNVNRHIISSYLSKVTTTLKDNVVGYECVNEPTHHMPEFVAWVASELRERFKVPVRYIMPGHRFMAPGVQPEGNDIYMETKKHLKKSGFHEGNKGVYYSKVVHGIDLNWMKDYAFIQKHLSKFFISNDGNRPRWEDVDWTVHLREFFSKENSAPPASKNRQLRIGIGFEHLCTIPGDADWEQAYGIRVGALGIAKAIEEYTGVKVYDDIIPPFDPVPVNPKPVDPKPKTIEERVAILEKRVEALENEVFVPGQ